MSTVDLREFSTPGRGHGLLDVFRRRYLLKLLVRKGTATRYRNSVLGWTWSYVKPLAQFVVYYFVMGIILQIHRDYQNFAIYLFAGVIIINLFLEGFGNATDSIVANGSLVKKIYLPREMFPVAAIIVGFIHFLPQMVILIIICLIVGWAPTWLGLAAIVGAIALVVSLALGLGLFFSGINVRFRDAQNFVDIIRMFATWTSPVLYIWTFVYDALPSWAFHIYMCNPLTVAVEMFHYAFWEATVDASPGLPHHFALYTVVAAAFCLVMLVVGQSTFRRFERSFAQDL